MRNLPERAYDVFKTGGLKRVGKRSIVFAKRRYYRALSHFDRISAEITLIQPPHKMIAGCLYPLRVQVKNTSRATFDRSYSVAAMINAVEGPHSRFMSPLAPGQTATFIVHLEVPRTTGVCEVTVDIVREECFWFSEVNSAPATYKAEIVPHQNEMLQDLPVSIDLTLDITNKCPLKCIQCRKTYFETFDEQQDMNFELYKRIAEEAFPYTRTVCLSSAGEPLMTRNFMEAIELAGRYAVQGISFISSGMHLDHNRAEKMIDYGVTRIEFSLDGASAEVYNKIRIGSNFYKVIKNIARLNELKKKKKSCTPMLRFNFVLMKSNIHELPAFIDLAYELGVEEVQTQHMVIFIDSVRDEALVFDRERSNFYIIEARERAKRHGIRFFHPPLFELSPAPAPEERTPLRDGQIWLQEDEFDYERKTHPIVNDGLQLCTDPWRKLYIDWQGQVFPCCVWKESPLGDFRTQSFPEIWHSPRYVELRKGLTSGPLGKSCAECSVITGGDINAERSYFF